MGPKQSSIKRYESRPFNDRTAKPEFMMPDAARQMYAPKPTKSEPSKYVPKPKKGQLISIL